MHPNVLQDVVEPPPGVAGDPLAPLHHEETLEDPHRAESTSFPHRRSSIVKVLLWNSPLLHNVLGLLSHDVLHALLQLPLVLAKVVSSIPTGRLVSGLSVLLPS